MERTQKHEIGWKRSGGHRENSPSFALETVLLIPVFQPVQLIQRVLLKGFWRRHDKVTGDVRNPDIAAHEIFNNSVVVFDAAANEMDDVIDLAADFKALNRTWNLLQTHFQA